MNYSNVDFSSEYETSRTLVDDYTFENLFLEVSCNIPVINEATVREQFEISLQRRIDDAREIFNDNLKNIVRKATADRNNKIYKHK